MKILLVWFQISYSIFITNISIKIWVKYLSWARNIAESLNLFKILHSSWSHTFGHHSNNIQATYSIWWVYYNACVSLHSWENVSPCEQNLNFSWNIVDDCFCILVTASIQHLSIYLQNIHITMKIIKSRPLIRDIFHEFCSFSHIEKFGGNCNILHCPLLLTD